MKTYKFLKIRTVLILNGFSNFLYEMKIYYGAFSCLREVVIIFI